jgi:predicted DNA-binding transcriptional regulator AlpA
MFPKPVMLGLPEKNGTSRWIESEVQEWLEKRPREKTDG